MRVLLTSILCKSGLMTHVLDLARSLAKRDIQVALAFKTQNPERAMHYQKWLAELKEIPVFYYTSSDTLIPILDQFGPNLIHSHSPSCFHSSLTGSTRLNLPLIITLHSTFPVEKWYPLTTLKARKIIAVGPIQAQSVPSFQNKTVVIPNGIDLTRFKPKPFRVTRTIRLCWFGRVDVALTPSVDRLNQALMLLRSQGVRLDAYFIGSAPKAERDQFHDLGWLDDPIFALQKTQVAFGHGRALREAMACGNVGHLLGAGYGGQVTRELLQKLGHLDAFPQYNLPPADPKQLALKILDLVNQPKKLAQLRSEANSIAVEYFDLETMATTTCKLYQEVLG